MRPFGELADCAARRPRAELERREPLVRAGRAASVADELGPAAEAPRRRASPGRSESRTDRRTDRGLGGERPLRRPTRRAPPRRRDRHGHAAVDDLDDRRDEVDVRGGWRKRKEHRRRRSREWRGRRAVGGGVDAATRPVGGAFSAASGWTVAAGPRRAKNDRRGRRASVRDHPGARALAHSAACEVAAAHEEPADAPVVEREKSALTPAVRRPSADAASTSRLAPEDRLVREDGSSVVRPPGRGPARTLIATGPRRELDVART